MVNDVWKRIGIILSVLWLIVAGCFECVVIYFVNWLYEDGPLAEYVWTLSLSMLAYIVFGLGPFLAFILLMKKRNETIGYRGLTVLALSETASSCPLSVGQPPSGPRVPQLDGIVRTPRSERLAVGREGD